MHPGRVLAEIYMRDHNLSQTDLAEKMGCAHRKINEIVNGKRSITPEFALELEKVFKAPADIIVQPNHSPPRKLFCVASKLKQWYL
jgi:addiction module HigA family antidote